MKRRAAVLLLAAAAVCGALAAGPAMAATGSAPAGHWGNARTVPGLKQLGSGREGELTVTSCPAPGTCAVFGNHSDASERQHAFHADETHGKWGKTVLVPGFTVQSGSCGGPGDCVVGGFDAVGKAATISEVSGTWSGPAPVPGIDALGGDAFLAAVSCGSPGNCAVIGEFDGARTVSYTHLTLPTTPYV